MPIADLTDWMADNTSPEIIWYVKRLSANDTLANKSHQAGPYIPKEFLFNIFPSIHRPEAENPDIRFDLFIDSHLDRKEVRAVWYNNKYRGKTRDEARLTGFGGQSSALLDPDSTGALTIFAFVLDPAKGQATKCHVWVCSAPIEEDLVEDRTGPVEPGKWIVWSPVHSLKPDLFDGAAVRTDCRLPESEIPAQWLQKFPTGREIISKAVELSPAHGLDPDVRIIKRRKCEFEVFLSLEEAVEMPVIQKGFGSIEEFVARAQSILQRRKARSGHSLELHAKAIFEEEELAEGRHFSHGPVSENDKKPDFLFPSQEAYRNPDFPAENLRMLAAKTTCRDRWRQILNEANRIETKHLLTLQEGVSVNQFNEMVEQKVQLVVPQGLHDRYPEEIRPHLMSFESFIADIRLLGAYETR